MRILYHTWLCPFSRKIRLQLSEKKLDFSLELERPWERRPAFLEMNPAGEVPVLVDLDATVICDSMALSEYLEEVYPETSFLGANPAVRAEVRRLMSWFDRKFYDEVTHNLVFQKVYKRAYGMGWPESSLIREGQSRIHDHLEYIGWLVDRRRWLAGDELSLADLAAAAQLSCIDYLGDVPWEKHELAKTWYMRIKSRPSFRTLLLDRYPALVPVAHYAELDF